MLRIIRLFQNCCKHEYGALHGDCKCHDAKNIYGIINRTLLVTINHKILLEKLRTTRFSRFSKIRFYQYERILPVDIDN